jgi:cytosine/adenosine deaminase-related metal-dependent hydrolase
VNTTAERIARHGAVFRGATIITGDPRLGIVIDGDLEVRDGIVAAVGTGLGTRGDEVEIDAGGTIIMPGFVDGHRHAWQGAFRRTLTDADLVRYLAATHAGTAPHYRPEDMYAGTVASLLGALDHGFTTVVDFSHNSRSSAHSDAALQASADAGIRVVHVSAPPNSGEWDHQWPDDLERVAAAASNAGGIVTVRAGIDMNRVEPAAGIIRRARGLGLGVHIDGVMGAASSLEIIELAGEGLLGPDVTLIHCTALSPEAWRAIRDAGTEVVLATVSDAHLGLAGGVPPVREIMALGLEPGLSVDVEVSLAGDPFTQMRSTALLQRMLAVADSHATGLPVGTLLGAADVLRFATSSSARTAGLGGVAGTLTPGRAADLLLVRPSGNTSMPVVDPVGTVVHGIDRSEIDAVLVAGRPLKWEGRLIHPHSDSLPGRLMASREHLIAAAGLPADLDDNRIRQYVSTHV